jgi:hypothetical protein
VYVIGHQAIGPDFGVSLPRVLGNQGDVVKVIAPAKKRFLTAISALSDMMRKTRNNESWHPGHNLTPFKRSEAEL